LQKEWLYLTKQFFHGKLFTGIAARTRDVIVSWLPLYHDMGLIAGFILPLLLKIPLVLLSPFDWVRAPQRLFHAIQGHGRATRRFRYPPRRPAQAASGSTIFAPIAANP
jgi:hypothetical protein